MLFILDNKVEVSQLLFDDNVLLIDERFARTY